MQFYASRAYSGRVLEATQTSALDRARAKIGGASALARAIGRITPQAISQWGRVPAERVLDVERVTGVSRHELRPDIFGEPATLGARAK